MYNCHQEVTWLVNKRLEPVNKPIKKYASLEPYLSTDQPPTMQKTAQSIQYKEKRLEVIVRFSSNSLAKGLKKTPKEWRVPIMATVVTVVTMTITQP